MTNKEILQANFLDILFENRNKDYGAYALRKGYNFRLLTAIGAGISVILLLLLVSAFKSNHAASGPVTKNREEVVLRTIEMPKNKIKEPVLPKKEVVKQVIKQKTVSPVTAHVKFTSPPKIVEVVKDPMASIDELDKKIISTDNVVGIPETKKVPVLTEPIESGTGSGPAAPEEKEFVIQERDPEFPGGADALKKFLARYLTTPDVLNAGEKKVVRIKFKVDKDGSVNTFEIITSGGNQFDNEVVRVAKKMPRWIPAIQNGINVPVSYVLPVTFIGVEE